MDSEKLKRFVTDCLYCGIYDEKNNLNLEVLAQNLKYIIYTSVCNFPVFLKDHPRSQIFAKQIKALEKQLLSRNGTKFGNPEKMLRDVAACNENVTNLLLSCYGLENVNSSSSLSELITEYVSESTGKINILDIYTAFNLKEPKQKSNARMIVKRLTEKGILERDNKRNGEYRKVNNKVDEMDFINAKEEIENVWLPMGLSKMVQIMPGNIIIVAGTSNTGKTMLLLNIIRNNMRQYKIHYYNSEMGEAELAKNLRKFDIPLNEWKFKAYERSDDFADVIHPGKGIINIIDFIEIHDNFYEIGGRIKEIHDKLKGSVCFISLQKNKGSDLAKGGTSSIEKARLALAIDYGRCKIVKAKNWINENPNGLVCNFDLWAGYDFRITKDWKLEK